MIESKSSSQASREGNRSFVRLSASETEDKAKDFCQRIDELLKTTCAGTVTLFKLGKVLGFKTYESARVVENSGLIRETAKKLDIPSAWVPKPLFSLDEAKKIATELAGIEIPQRRAKTAKKDDKEGKEVSVATAAKELSESERTYSILDVGRSLGFKVYEYENVRTVQNSGLIRETAKKLGIVTAYDRKPNFSLEETKRIVAKLIPEEPIKSPRKKIHAIKESVNQISDENRTIMLGERKIIFSKISGKKMVILKILAETSAENPISISLLAKKVYDDGVDFRAAKNRVGAMLYNLRRSLEEYDLAIMIREIKKGGKGGGRTVYYYLVDKSSSVKANGLEEKSTESPIPVKGDIFNAGEEKEEVDSKNEIDVSVSDTVEMSELLTPKEKLDPEFLLTEDEVCIIAVGIYYRGAFLGINTAPIRIRDEIEELFKNIAKRLDDGGQKRVDLEKESLLPAIIKLKKFQEDREKYLEACSKVAKIVLDCFDGVKITDDLLEILFSEEEQIKIIKEAKAKREV